jgi:predicted nucleic acid-binding protein
VKTSTATVFLDTNILVYAAMGREKEERKRARANELVRPANFGTSAQVLQEFYTAVTRKGGSPLTPDEAFAWIELLIGLPCVAIDPPLVLRGIWISERYRINYWDGAVLAAAEELRAETLYTEDLSHGQIYGTVRAVNPFL